MMFKNYFLIFFRNMARNKIYAAINVIGLAIGIASCILIYLYVQHELSYDRSFSKNDRIYRVVNDLIVEDEVEKASITHAALAPTLAADYPEIEATTRMLNRKKQVLRLGEKAIAIDNVFWVDSNYFQLFDYKLLEGDPKTALLEPNTMVVTEQVAARFFDNPLNAMHSTLQIGTQSYKVTGIFIGLVAGSYPAFVLSHFKPVDIIKSGRTPMGGGAILRKSLVVIQFTISLVLIIGTVVVYSQMHFLKNQDLGFTKDQVVVIDIPSGDTTIVNKMPVMKEELLKNPNITSATTTVMIPGESTGVIIFAVERNNQMAEKTMNSIWVDYEFLDLMDIQLKEGRNFSEGMRTDLDNGFILNEAAVKALGWTDPIGKRIGFSDTTAGKVVGVVKDFNYKSLHSGIEPLVIMLAPQNNGYLMARMAPGNIRETIAHIEATWQQMAPSHPLEYFFLDESFNEQYRAEEKMLAIFGYFALLTILIACMGLFGLASFMAEQRTREIGIRKVLNSSISQIVVLLTKDFALLVLLAIILACPIAWYGMHTWLQDFAYRTPISVWIFVLSGLIALALAICTVSLKAARAAMSDPVLALRTE